MIADPRQVEEPIQVGRLHGGPAIHSAGAVIFAHIGIRVVQIVRSPAEDALARLRRFEDRASRVLFAAPLLSAEILEQVQVPGQGVAAEGLRFDVVPERRSLLDVRSSCRRAYVWQAMHC